MHMRNLKLCTAFATALLAAATPAAARGAAKLAPVRIILAGDSTMARKSGYGDAFCAAWRPEVTCINAGRGGRSTKSYRVDGIWEQSVLAELRKPDAPDGRAYAATYVLMQFGHNDGSQKPERHTDVLWEYPANLAGFAKEARAAGANFILVTPLTMRNFVDGRLRPDRVAPYAASMHDIAIVEHIPLLDLFAESQKAVQAMGLVKSNHRLAGQPVPANVLSSEVSGTSVEPKREMDASQAAGSAAQPFDYTHLNQQEGASLFGNIVVRLLTANQPKLAHYRK